MRTRLLAARAWGFSPAALPIVLIVLLGLVYLRWAPASPDYAAQVARTGLVRRAGNVSWWTGWFGGISLPSYSVLVPSWMAVIGVRATAAIAALATAGAGAILAGDAERPRAGGLAFAVAGFADVLAGRVTFAVGLAFAVWALVALRALRALLAVAAAALAFLASPLAGLFLGLILLAVMATDPWRRRLAASMAAVLLALGIGMAVLFPGTGIMPFRATDMVPPAAGCLVVLLVCPPRVVRVSATLTLVAMPVFFVLPGAVGGNIARLAWVCAPPVVIACARLSRRWLFTAVAALAVWPITDLAEQVVWVADRSSAAAYYRTLTDALATEQARVSAGAVGERVEVLDTVDHGPSLHLSTASALARGWDRQADNADNPIFYRRGALNADTYHSWLHQLAVGWVAVPAAPLDYAAVEEAKLIRGGLRYLRLAWESPDWKLYRVIDAAPLAAGATVRSVTPSGVTLTTVGPGDVELRVRWSAYLRLVDATSRMPVPSCITNADGWTRIYVPRRGTFTLTSPFEFDARFRDSDADCQQDLAAR